MALTSPRLPSTPERSVTFAGEFRSRNVLKALVPPTKEESQRSEPCWRWIQTACSRYRHGAHDGATGWRVLDAAAAGTADPDAAMLEAASPFACAWRSRFRMRVCILPRSGGQTRKPPGISPAPRRSVGPQAAQNQSCNIGPAIDHLRTTSPIRLHCRETYSIKIPAMLCRPEMPPIKRTRE